MPTIDYSKWDRLDVSSSSDDENENEWDTSQPPSYPSRSQKGSLDDVPFHNQPRQGVLPGGTKSKRTKSLRAKSFPPGSRVVLHSLVARPELNGREGVICLKKLPKTAACDRIPVQLFAPTGGALKLPSGAPILLKPSNISLATVPTDSNDADAESTAILEGLVGAGPAAHVRSKLDCTRCGEPCAPGTRCRVPHPPHLQVDMGGQFGAGGSKWHYQCKACSCHYTLSKDDPSDEGMVCIDGPAYCFEGEHTTQPIPASDKRRVSPDLVSLEPSPDLQARLDELPITHPNLRVLIVRAHMYDDQLRPTLNVALPHLEEIQLIDVAFNSVTLDESTTPNLRKLRMQNIDDSADLTLSLPLLEEVTIHYYGGNPYPIETMLAAATRLRTFDSYKLWCGDCLCFASNDLTEVSLHRSDSLNGVSLWAPRLRSLNLQACYSIEEVEILDDHPLKAELPFGFPWTRFLVITQNANISPEALAYLGSHPRVELDHDSDLEGDGAGYGNSMEALHLHMRRAMQENGLEGMFAAMQMQMQQQYQGCLERMRQESEDDDDDDEYESEESEWETDDEGNY